MRTPESKTTVVNLRTDTYDVYGGRPAKHQVAHLGNPFTRAVRFNGLDALDLHRFYFLGRVAHDLVFRNHVLDQRGKRIGCFCKPEPCHCDVIAAWLEFEVPDPIHELERFREALHKIAAWECTTSQDAAGLCDKCGPCIASEALMPRKSTK